MISIFIVEDNKQYLNFIEKEIETCLVTNNYNMQIVIASNKPQDVIDNLQQNSIYFLDVDLNDDNHNGFSLANTIKEFDKNSYIVYITSHQELAFQTFKHRIKVVDYIIKEKPILVSLKINEVLNELNTIILSESMSQHKYLNIKVFNEIHNILISDIIAIETSPIKHRLILTTTSTRLDFFGSLQEVITNLDNSFMRIHQSYIVNLKAIQSFNIKESYVILKNKQKCLVSRKMKKELSTKII